MSDSDKNEKSFGAIFREGTRLLHQGKTADALPLLEKAYQLEPTNVDAAINVCGAYILTKRFKRAVEVLEPMSDSAPDNAMIWTNLGAAYLGNPVLARDEEQLRAIEAFKKAYDLNPATPNVAYNIGLIYRDRKETDQARYWLQQALKANPNDRHAKRLIEKLDDSDDQEESGGGPTDLP